MLTLLNLSFFATSLGYNLSLFFIPILILNISNSPLFISLAYALNILPYIIISPFVGALSDSYHRKKLILYGEFGCVIAVLALFFIPEQESYIYLVLLIGFLISTFSASHHPIFQSILPEIFPPQALAKVNGDIASISSLTSIIAPAVLGIVFAFIDSKFIILAILLCYLTSFFTFLHIPYQHQDITQKTSILLGLKNAVTFINTQPILKQISFSFFFVNLGFQMVFASLVWIYANQYSLSNSVIALCFTVIGFMSIIGAKFAGKYLVGHYSEIKIVILSLAAIAVITLTMPLFSSAGYITAAWGMVSLLDMFIVVTFFTYRQKITPKELLGKVISLTRLIAFLAIPPASLLSGYLIQQYQNANIIYLIGGLIMLFSSLFYYFKLRKFN